MRTYIQIALFASFCSVCNFAHAEPEKPFTLTTLQGKTYEKVHVMAVEADGIRITHTGGAAKLDFNNLSKDLREKYGYDKSKADEHKAKVAKQAKADLIAAVKYQEELAR